MLFLKKKLRLEEGLGIPIWYSDHLAKKIGGYKKTHPNQAFFSSKIPPLIKSVGFWALFKHASGPPSL
jgi:hypothetical protein